MTLHRGLRRALPSTLRRRPFRWGSFRRLTPISTVFGFDRGVPIDRHYIETFLSRHHADIRGRVLELADAGYTRRFGRERVTRSEVLHAVEGNPDATIVGDLASGRGIPRSAFDCFILTQTLPFIYDVRGAVAHCHAALRPGGVLLATVPGICQIARYEMDHWGDFWRFTDLSARRLFEDVFSASQVEVEAYGNLLAAVSLLQGISADELSSQELEFFDRDYPVTIAVRAVRPA